MQKAIWRLLRERADGARGGSRADRGISTIEVVILAPVMLLFILVLVGFGQLVDGRGAIDGAARDAARAGSIQHSYSVAANEARKAADSDLKGVCSGPVTVTDNGAANFTQDNQGNVLYTVEVSCTIRGLSMLGLNIPKKLTGKASSPIDPYKHVEG